ncbi:MAG: FHA domain-containing protein [Gemmataceae bacterium]|nr:FHA domain-containing protein [Gemmataceae bacterium]
MEVKLVVLAGKHQGREIVLPPTIFLIGRDTRCHLRPHCRLVSRLHCAIARWAGKVEVRDLKSANGTLLNHRQVTGQVRVWDGDVLQVGALQCVFRIRAEPGDPPAPPGGREELEWLLKAPADSFVLDPARTTFADEILPGFADLSGVESRQGRPPEIASSVALSAGQYLRDYLNMHR